MTGRRRWVVLAFPVVIAACASDTTRPRSAGSSPILTTVAASAHDPIVTTSATPPETVPSETTIPAPDDPIPVDARTADRGCVDTPGSLHASVAAWYPGIQGSSLALSGDLTTSPQLDNFEHAVADAVQRTFPEFAYHIDYEAHLAPGGCVTYRSAVFTNGDDELVVSTWRVESAANPNFVPNEAPFTAINNTTLVSRGDHIQVVLTTARDGTTLRVTAYGSGAVDQIAGWPTTIAPRPSAPPPGPAPATADQLVPLSQVLLTAVLDQRS